MTLFVIHVMHGQWTAENGQQKWVSSGKAIPLLWDLDDETKSRVGHDVSMTYAFVDRAEAELVLEQVPDLFDMDDAKASTLHLVEFTA